MSRNVLERALRGSEGSVISEWAMHVYYCKGRVGTIVKEGLGNVSEITC